MHVGMITQWYDPEPGPAALPGALARGLVHRGHAVTVLTGFPNYPSGKIADGYSQSARQVEEREGVRVVRTPLYANHDASAVRRIANYGSFAASATALGAWSLKDVDALYVNYSPITTAVPMWAAQVMSRAKVVLDVSDLWPDTMLAAGLGGGGRLHDLASPLLHAWTNAMYSSSDSVTYISPGVGEILEGRGVPAEKLHYIPKWTNQEVPPGTGRSMRGELGIAEGTLVITYAGTIGEAQGLDSLVEAMRRVTHLDAVCLVAGSGTAEAALRSRAEGMGNVQFLGRLPFERMPDLLATTDLGYVSLSDHPLSPVTMPSKTQANLAAGVPLLVSAPGDLAQVVRQHQVGFATGPEDASGVAGLIQKAVAMSAEERRAMAMRARTVYEQQFSLERGVSAYELLLQRAAERKRS